MIAAIYRKKTAEAFSIEQLFNTIYSAPVLKQAGIQKYEMPYVSKGLASVLRNMLYTRAIKDSEILHITGDVHYAALLCLFKKTVITVHDCVTLQRGNGLKKLVFWLLWFKLPLSFASAVTVISEKTKQELLQVVDIAEEKITVIPNCYAQEFTLTPKEFAAGKARILHVGTRPNKNLPRVVEALQGLPVVLVIVGVLDQVQRDVLAKCRVEYENHVGVSQAQMVELYQGSDVISFPSTYEGFGLPILEGQAVGRPVLTSALAPMSEVCGEGGAVLVDPYSVESIRQGFREIIENPQLRRSLLDQGRKNSALHTPQAIAEQYLRLYERLLND